MGFWGFGVGASVCQEPHHARRRRARRGRGASDRSAARRARTARRPP